MKIAGHHSPSHIIQAMKRAVTIENLIQREDFTSDMRRMKSSFFDTGDDVGWLSVFVISIESQIKNFHKSRHFLSRLQLLPLWIVTVCIYFVVLANALTLSRVISQNKDKNEQTMDTAIITWFSVLTLVCVFVMIKMFLSIRQRHTDLTTVRSHTHLHPAYRHIVERSNESEMLFIPGDSVNGRRFDNDYNADDNF